MLPEVAFATYRNLPEGCTASAIGPVPVAADPLNVQTPVTLSTLKTETVLVAELVAKATSGTAPPTTPPTLPLPEQAPSIRLRTILPAIKISIPMVRPLVGRPTTVWQVIRHLCISVAGLSASVPLSLGAYDAKYRQAVFRDNSEFCTEGEFGEFALDSYSFLILNTNNPASEQTNDVSLVRKVVRDRKSTR